MSDELGFSRDNKVGFSRDTDVGFSRDNKAGFSRDTYVGFRRDGKPKPNEPAVFGPSVREPQKTLEINRVPDALAVGTTGPFCKVYKDGSNWMLLGGTVTGGEGNETVEDINLGSVASPPDDGDHHWLKINYTAEEEDDVLLPGGEVTSVTDGSGTSLPSNDIPTVSSLTGFIYVSLGSWQNEAFIPSGCGNFQVSHCPGNLSYTRGGYTSDYDY